MKHPDKWHPGDRIRWKDRVVILREHFPEFCIWLAVYEDSGLAVEIQYKDIPYCELLNVRELDKHQEEFQKELSDKLWRKFLGQEEK